MEKLKLVQIVDRVEMHMNATLDCLVGSIKENITKDECK